MDQIVTDLHLAHKKVKTRDNPAMLSKLLKRNSISDPRDGYFDYRSVIWKLNYMENGSQLD